MPPSTAHLRGDIRGRGRAGKYTAELLRFFGVLFEQLSELLNRHRAFCFVAEEAVGVIGAAFFKRFGVPVQYPTRIIRARPTAPHGERAEKGYPGESHPGHCPICITNAPSFTGIFV